MQPIPFTKYQAIGNDYLVVDAAAAPQGLTPHQVGRICDRHFGIGSDGILLAQNEPGRFRLRILNPDGSEAEKSGNGLRIFARYLWDTGQVGLEPFAVETSGGTVRCQVLEGGRSVGVEMGRARFESEAIPVLGPPREVLGETLQIDGEQILFSAASMGNPHCVIFGDDPGATHTESAVRRLGPQIEHAPIFPNRTNVQFAQVIDRQNLYIHIWERGVGYTLASGTSGCAAAAVAVRLGYCDPQLQVHSPGGMLTIHIAPDYGVHMRGPVVRVAEGRIFLEIFDTDR